MVETYRGVLSNTHIAVIDDDPSVRHALRRLLRSIGFAAVTFGNADDFLRSQNQTRQDCLILDIQMPGLNGLELQKVIASSKHPVPIIFMTAHSQMDQRKQALQNGAIGFLEKPFDDFALIKLLQRALKQSRQKHPL